MPPADVSSAATHTAVDGSGGNVADGAAVVCRYYSDYDEDAEADGDVISIHDDDSEPESSTTEPAAKQSRLSDDAASWLYEVLHTVKHSFYKKKLLRQHNPTFLS